MPDILQDLIHSNLCTAIDANMAAFIPIFGKLGHAFDTQPPGLKRSITDIPMSLFNSVVDTRLDSTGVLPAIAIVQADARKYNVPVLWWVGPTTRPADLVPQLQQAGFTVDEDGPGMAVELDQLDDDLPWVAGLSIEHADGELAWRQWTRTMALGFEAPCHKLEFLENNWTQLFQVADPSALLPYTACLDGRPVATSLLFLAGGVAGIYSVATVPDARRKGIGAWITLYPLLHARSLGYRAGVLEASPMGESVYQSLGFREFCQVTSYRWSPETRE